jgi:hypothetical protein
LPRWRFHDVEKANHSPRQKSKDDRLTDGKEESARETTRKLYLSRTLPKIFSRRSSAHVCLEFSHTHSRSCFSRLSLR